MNNMSDSNGELDKQGMTLAPEDMWWRWYTLDIVKKLRETADAIEKLLKEKDGN